MFGAFAAGEQACIREALGDEAEALLARPLLSEGETQEWEASVYACLAPETARAVLLAGLVAALQEEEGLELGDAELACLRETMAAVDVAALIAETLPGSDGEEATNALVGGIVACVPAFFLQLAFAEMGVELEGLDVEARICLEGLMREADWPALVADAEAGGVRLTMELFGCVPSLFLTSAFGVELELRASEAACLREAFAVTIEEDLAEGSPSEELAAELVGCVPDLFILVMLGELWADREDVSEGELACLRGWAAERDRGDLLAAQAAGDGAVAEAFAAGFVACVPDLLVLQMTGEPVQLDEVVLGCFWEQLAETGGDDLGEGYEVYMHYATMLLACDLPDVSPPEDESSERGSGPAGASCAAANPGLVRDCEALLRLRDRLAGGGRALNWSADLVMTSWTGVTVAGSPQRVTKLELASSGLTGQVSGLLGNLTGLTELRLNGNRLTGRLPSKLGQLTNLTHVYLASNRFTGCVPSLLRTVTNNDVASLGLTDCAAPVDIVADSRTLTAGIYKFVWKEGEAPLIFDVPPGLKLKLRMMISAIPRFLGEGRPVTSGRGLLFTVVGSESSDTDFLTLSGLILDAKYPGVEWNRNIVAGDVLPTDSTSPSLEDLFDSVVESSWVGEAE